MRIVPLQEGIFWAGKNKEFRLVSAIKASEVPQGALKMAVCPFLIVLPDGLVLLDTGLGFAQNGMPIILSLLENAGYRPEQLTKVLLSHLHKDHTDGLGYFNDGRFVTHFPNATVYLQKRELDYALTQPENPSFNQQTLEAIKMIPNIRFMDAGSGTIGPYITYEVTGGHSPFHQVFWLRQDGQTAFYGGDNLPQEAYLKYHIVYKTDYEGKKAMALRQQWEVQARAEGWQLLLYHDLEKPVLEL